MDDLVATEHMARQYSDRLVDARAENERLRAYAKRATTALREVRPLGGSELFIQVNGETYADPEYCGNMIRQMRDELHQYRRAEALARK